MTALAVLFAMTAVLLVLPPSLPRRLEREQRNGHNPRSGVGDPRRQRGPLLLALALVLAPVLTLLLAGARAAVLATAAAVVVASGVRLAALRARRSAAARARGSVAEACRVLWANVRVGMVPAEALARAASSCELLREGQRTLALGGDVTAVWRRQAAADGFDGLHDLARGWQVGTRSGASLTGTLEQVATGVSADLSLQAVVDSELAAPRATGRVMAALPAFGMGMGYLLGGDPMRWLTAGPAGWACLVLGVALACAGVLWIESLARRAAGRG